MARLLGNSDLELSSLQLVGKFNLGKLYEYIGFNKEIISRGKYAEILAAEHRPFRYLLVMLTVICECLDHYKVGRLNNFCL